MNDLINYLRKYSNEEKHISGRNLANHFGISDIKVREYINRARREGIPICSSGDGYYFSDNKSHIAKTVRSLRNRISSTENAIAGLSSLLA